MVGIYFFTGSDTHHLAKNILIHNDFVGKGGLLMGKLVSQDSQRPQVDLISALLTSRYLRCHIQGASQHYTDFIAFFCSFG
jgi:hypothetical protein